MPIIAMTKEMGSLGTLIGLEAARQLGYEFLRNEVIKAAAHEYRVLEAGLIGAVERPAGVFERLRPRAARYAAYLRAAVLEAALRDEVLFMGRWSTMFLGGVRHAVRVRVCAPVEVRAQRIMTRLRVDHAEAVQRISAYDEGVRGRLRQIFGVDWTDPLLYDLVINTEAVTQESGVRQVVALAGAPEFQPTEESRAALWNQAVAARVQATLKANAVTAAVDVDVQVTDGQARLAGIVASDDERDSVLSVARGVRGVVGVTSEVKVFKRPVR
ncbi:MAG TPA: cytidylate kinase family protein [Methylomirabilota bacterium]|nr:cytidylate kinase family protein [Methylomirabilota bacterium]